MVAVLVLVLGFIGAYVIHTKRTKSGRRTSYPSGTMAASDAGSSSDPFRSVQMTSVSVASPVVSHAVAVPQGVPMPSGDYKVISFISSLSLGLGLSESPTGGVIVSSVEDKELAVPVGTKILAVNGQSCAGMVKADVTSMVRAAKTAGPKLTITFDLLEDDEEVTHL